MSKCYVLLIRISILSHVYRFVKRVFSKYSIQNQLMMWQVGRVGPGGVVRSTWCFQKAHITRDSRPGPCRDPLSSIRQPVRSKSLDTGLAAVVGNWEHRALTLILVKSPPDPNRPACHSIKPLFRCTLFKRYPITKQGASPDVIQPFCIFSDLVTPPLMWYALNCAKSYCRHMPCVVN